MKEFMKNVLAAAVGTSLALGGITLVQAKLAQIAQEKVMAACVGDANKQVEALGGKDAPQVQMALIASGAPSVEALIEGMCKAQVGQ